MYRKKVFFRAGQKKVFLGLGLLAALMLGITCENTVIETKAPLDEFAGEEYGEDWEWPDLPPLVLSETALTLGAGETASLTAEIEGEAAEVWWTSNKAGVVSVDEDGKVKAHGQGAAQIKATAKTGGQTAVCAVTVKISAAGLYRNDEASPIDLSGIGGEDDNLLVKSFAYIKANSTEGDAYTIVLDEDISDNSKAGFSIGSGVSSSSTGNDAKNKNLTITLQGLDETRTITKTNAGALFTVYGSTDAEADTPHLILGENITLAGYNSNTSALVVAGYTQSTNNYIGKLTMKTGSRITGNTNTSNNAAGGGVNVVAGGTFIMEDGVIGSMVEADGNFAKANAGKGGGVIVSGSFSMNGGTIAYNKAGSASVSGNANGAGVSVAANGYFIMSDGLILNNNLINTSGTAPTGGGVHVSGVFDMSGGEIRGNTAPLGGGVAVAASKTFKMTGGVIAGNTASRQGAAILLYNATSSTFQKTTGGIVYGTESTNANTVATGTTAIVHAIAGSAAATYYYDETIGEGTTAYAAGGSITVQ